MDKDPDQFRDDPDGGRGAIARRADAPALDRGSLPPVLRALRGMLDARLRFAFVALLGVLVAFGSALPAYARAVGGPHLHACHCEVRGGHATCACPLCFPELRDIETFDAPSVTGRCGTDDPGWRTLSTPGVPSSAFVLVAPLARLDVPSAPLRVPTQWGQQPELPPPRSTLSPIAI